LNRIFQKAGCPPLPSLDALTAPMITEADYADPHGLFLENSRGLEGEILLDGTGDADGAGRYSVLAMNPLFTVRAVRNRAVLKWRDGEFSFPADPPEVIRLLESLLPLRGGKNGQFFDGGLVFLLSYEMNRFYENIPQGDGEPETPDLWCGFYPNVQVFDRLKKESRLISRAPFPAPPSGAKAETGYAVSEFICDEPADSYLSKIRAIKNYIANGDVYQVNLSRSLTAEFGGSAEAFFGDLRRTNPASYGAFINGGDFRLLSMSPELFFKTDGHSIKTMPIKGTAPRGADPAEDEKLARALASSGKDKAENVMIVDLMRNDLSRICLPDSVKVPRLCAHERLPTVHHLVSTVTGLLKENVRLSNILSAVYPGGSITGAPKIRAMEIISELETSPRGFYCGSIIAGGLNGTVTASLLIRSLTIKNGKAVYRTGGGITADSDPDEELRETEHKAEMLKLLPAEKVTGHA
jgi:para-aminobenzoate synthetase component 1